MTLPKMPRCPAILSKKLTFKPLIEKVILQNVRGHFGFVNHVIVSKKGAAVFRGRACNLTLSSYHSAAQIVYCFFPCFLTIAATVFGWAARESNTPSGTSV